LDLPAYHRGEEPEVKEWEAVFRSMEAEESVKPVFVF